MDKKTKTLVRSSAATMTNPDDLHALEEAVKLKKEKAGEIVAVTMGPPTAIDVLQEALLYGADRAILVSDWKFAGSDTLATSRVLAATATKLAPFRMLFFGRMAIDGDTAQVGPEVAALLNIPQATQVSEFKEWGSSSFTYLKEIAHQQQLIEIAYPAVATIAKETNRLHAPTIQDWREAQFKEIEFWNSQNLKLDPTLLGLEGSPTQVVETQTPQIKKSTQWITSAQQLIHIIQTQDETISATTK